MCLHRFANCFVHFVCPIIEHARGFTEFGTEIACFLKFSVTESKIVRRRKLENILKEGLLRGRILERKIVRKRLLIKLLAEIGVV